MHYEVSKKFLSNIFSQCIIVIQTCRLNGKPLEITSTVPLDNDNITL